MPARRAQLHARTCLEKNLQRDRDRAAALEKVDRLMEVDLVRRRQHRSRLGVVTGPHEGEEAPLLDDLDLGLEYGGEVCGGHHYWV